MLELTSTPMRMRFVLAASAASTVQASKLGSADQLG